MEYQYWIEQEADNERRRLRQEAYDRFVPAGCIPWCTDCDRPLSECPPECH